MTYRFATALAISQIVVRLEQFFYDWLINHLFDLLLGGLGHFQIIGFRLVGCVVLAAPGSESLYPTHDSLMFLGVNSGRLLTCVKKKKKRVVKSVLG